MRTRNVLGFSLIEMMIVVALMTTVALSALQVLKMMMDANAYNQAAADIQSTVNGVRMSLSNNTVCTQALTSAGSLPSLTANYNPVTPNATTFAVNSLAALFSTGSVVSGAPELVLQSAQFYKFQDISPDPVMNPESQFVGRLQLVFQTVTAHGNGGLQVQEIPVLFSTTPAGNSITLTGCTASAGPNAADQAAICATLGLTFNPLTNQCNATSPQTTCATLGGTWGGSSCALPTAAAN